MAPIVVAVAASTDDPVEKESSASRPIKSVIGIIYPPPEIRNIVDKTANFVARNGPDFENRIKQNELNNPKFNFLNAKDPYHAYYQHKVKEFREGKSEAPLKSASTLVPAKVQEIVKAAEQFVPKEPPAEFEFIADPSTINASELDVIKLTAQFVARNGRQFLTQLMNRESRNYLFDFLKPQHSNFNYFTKLVEQYTKVLIPSRDIIVHLKKEAANPKEVMDQVKYRVEWTKHQQRIKEKQDAELEKERVAYASIDWHDFVVVQTVDFQPHEQMNLPPPCTPNDVGARIIAQQRMDASKTTQAMEMDVESDEEEADETERGDAESNAQDASNEMEFSGAAAAQRLTKIQQPLLQPPKPDSVVIRRDYNPKVDKVRVAEQQKFVISPLTGEKIPADKLAEHMRFNTIDSQYFKQREEQAGRHEEEPVFAPGADIFSNIKGFAERRSDIFGRGAEETLVGRKMGEEQIKDTNPKAIWDGYTSSVESATKAAQSQITIEEQIAQIHRSKGLVADESKERIGPQGASASSANVGSAGVPPVPAQPQLVKPPAPDLSSAKEPSTVRSAAVAPLMQPRPVMPTSLGAVRLSMPAGTIVPTLLHVPSQPIVVLPPSQPQIAVGIPIGMMPVAQFRPVSVSAGMQLVAPPPPSVPQPPAASVSAALARSEAVATEDEDAGPPSKRQKTEDQLVPEQDFLKTHRGPVTICVNVPNIADRSDWTLTGQTLRFTFSLTETISTVKAKIQEATSMPTSKQKLTCEGMFVKDSNSLAFYNMEDGSALTLQLKERGGRKK